MDNDDELLKNLKETTKYLRTIERNLKIVFAILIVYLIVIILR